MLKFSMCRKQELCNTISEGKYEEDKRGLGTCTFGCKWTHSANTLHKFSVNSDFFTQEAIKKLPKPETFDGTINATLVQNFVDDISDYFELMELNDLTKMRHLRYYLVKQAKTWYLHNMHTFVSFPDIIEKLKKNFESTDFQRSLRTQFAKLKQKDSVRKFAEELLVH